MQNGRIDERTRGVRMWSWNTVLRAQLLGVALSPGLSSAQTSSAAPLLWYRQPARIWNVRTTDRARDGARG